MSVYWVSDNYWAFTVLIPNIRNVNMSLVTDMIWLYIEVIINLKLSSNKINVTEDLDIFFLFGSEFVCNHYYISDDDCDSRKYLKIM